jgi:acyl-CoA thioesterase-1
VSDDTAASARQVLPARVVARSTPAAAPDPTARTTRVVFLGDSLTAGLGLDEAQAYPAVVERELRKEGVAVQVVNAGVSGDTSAGGLSRLPWLLGQRPDIVVVALGANDGLRALPVEETEKNLREIVRRSQAAGARVLLVGMRIPPNYGPDYAGRFEAMYARIAEDLGVPLVPFLLEGVGGEQSLNQADGIHPTAEGQELLARNVLTYLAEVLKQRSAGSLDVAGAR